MKPKLILGLSGGVDSAVSAALLRESYDVHCVFLDIGLGGGGDAEALADRLGLPFHSVDIRAELEHFVCADFAREYLAGRTPLPCARCNPLVKFPDLNGRTPNPCIDCNRFMKFDRLFDRADVLGGTHIATGHYARVTAGPDGRMLLRKGQPANDQSYMLSRLTQALLRHIVFPLGGYEKVQVRALAEEMGLFVAHKPDSMEICFIPDGDYAAWLDRRGPTPPPGNFIDGEGRVLGRHLGIHHYTIGQRRGLGIPAEHRLFVSEIRPGENTVVLSDGTDLMAHAVWGEGWNPLAPLESGEGVTLRLRHSKTETPARFLLTPDGPRAELLAPARAPTPGQLAVLYRGDTVLGSFWITGATRLGNT